MTEKSAGPPAGAATGPVVVLTYAHSGFPVLADLLSVSRRLTCSSGDGVLTACHSAAETWRRIDNRSSGLSALAAKSIRLMTSTMVAAVQAASPGARWCETEATVPVAARDFAEVFPEATFVSLHRDLRGVLGSAAAAWPWGLANSPFWPFAAKNPGDTAAAVAAYWIVNTEELLDFEDDHADACLRLHYEDVAAEPRRVAETLIYPYLGLDPGDLRVLGPVRAPGPPEAAATPQLPHGLIARVNALSLRLGYDRWPSDAS